MSSGCSSCKNRCEADKKRCACCVNIANEGPSGKYQNRGIDRIADNSLEIWPDTSRTLFREKCIDPVELVGMFRSNVIFPWSADYDKRRTFFSQRIQQRPLIIVTPLNQLQIEDILNYCFRKKLSLRVVNGRHSTQLISPEVLVDMSDMNNIARYYNRLTKVDRLVAEGGATQGQANDFIFKGYVDTDMDGVLERSTSIRHDCYPPFGHLAYARGVKVPGSEYPGGSAGTVGIAGLSSIGGIGVLRRQFGLTIDSILSWTITLPPKNCEELATTKIVRATSPAQADRDLFWALNGGGANNFGIVNKIEYTLLPLRQVIDYTVSWDVSKPEALAAGKTGKDTVNWEKVRGILTSWTAAVSTGSEHVPAETFTEELDIKVLPTGDHKRSFSIVLDGNYVVPEHQSYEVATGIIQARLSTSTFLGNGKITIEPPRAYRDTYEQLIANRAFYQFSILQALFVPKITQPHITTIIDMMSASMDADSSGSTLIELELNGGKIKSNTGVGCFPFRRCDFFVACNSSWNALQDSQWQEQWLIDVLSGLTRAGIDGVYLGFPITFPNVQKLICQTNKLSHANQMYYGSVDNFNKVKAIRDMIDPANVLSPMGTLIN